MASAITQWALAGAAVLLPFLVAFLCQVARQYIGRIQDERLRALILRLVEAAEQIYGGGGGQTKKNYVQGKLRELGYEPDETEIEAAVLTANEKAAKIEGFRAEARELPVAPRRVSDDQ